MKTTITPIIIILACGVTLFGVLYVMSANDSITQSVTTPQPQSTDTRTSSENESLNSMNGNLDSTNLNYAYEPTVDMDTNSWSLYKNSDWDVSFRYPREFKTYDETHDRVEITKASYIDRDVARPFITVTRYLGGQDSLEEWLGARGINKAFTDIKITDTIGKLYTVTDETPYSIAYFMVGDDVFAFSVVAWYDYEFFDIYDAVLNSVNKTPSQNRSSNNSSNTNNNPQNINTNYEPTIDMNIKTWKIHNKPEWGISFRYPQEFSVYYDGPDQINITKSNLVNLDREIPLILFSREKISQNSLEDWMLIKGFSYSFSNISISGLDGKQHQSTYAGESISRIVYVFVNGFVYSFSVGDWSHREFLDVYDGMLSTVHTTAYETIKPLSDWQEYYNANQGYTIYNSDGWYLYTDTNNPSIDLFLSTDPDADSVLSLKDRNGVVVDIQTLHNIQDIDEYLNAQELDEKTRVPVAVTKIEKIRLGNETIRKWTRDTTMVVDFEGSYQIFYYKSLGNKILVFTASALQQSAYLTHKDEIEELVSTAHSNN
ncbi:MAG: hypothetical protein A3I91_05685 [Candidatus Kerfeldbacteria bacterium RIFCSPLOWO2_02_FULL_42_19]|nr:MAG: hypothetical protein A3I91_05685 [Candidatus Kerfeldbacteria bacterium RIFCSPLOWO2_02_FULL_42_19]